MRAAKVVATCALFLALQGCQGAPELVEQDPHSPIASCAFGLPPEVDAKLKPYLLARAAMRRGVSRMAGQAEVELGRLLIGSDSGSREARVALLAYYVGEHPAEELFCAVLKEPELTAPLVAKYSACRPLTSVEHQLAGVVVLGTVYAHVSEALAKGEKC